MYNQGNMRLHVDLFIKYVSSNVYSDNNHGQPQSILNIFLTFLVAYTLWQPFVAYFRSDIDIIVFFCWAGWKWVGRRDCLANKFFFFTSSGAQRWAEREMGNTKKNTATLMIVGAHAQQTIDQSQTWYQNPRWRSLNPTGMDYPMFDVIRHIFIIPLQNQKK